MLDDNRLSDVAIFAALAGLKRFVLFTKRERGRSNDYHRFLFISALSTFCIEIFNFLSVKFAWIQFNTFESMFDFKLILQRALKLYDFRLKHLNLEKNEIYYVPQLKSVEGTMIINDDEKSTRRLQRSARHSARRSARGQRTEKQDPPPEKVEKQDPRPEKVETQQTAAQESEVMNGKTPKEAKPMESTTGMFSTSQLCF